MKRKLLDIPGDKDFILRDDGLLIYSTNHATQQITSVYINNTKLAQLHEQIPFGEIVKKHKALKAEEKKTEEFWTQKRGEK